MSDKTHSHSPCGTDSWPGSRWWRFDFHTHTPASSDYRGDPRITPEEWLLGFMRAEIDCVAVTDHNSGEWIDKLKTALRSESLNQHKDFRPLTLFPGIELSVNGGVHLLALFDPSCNAADVEALRGAVGYLGTPGDSDAVTEASIHECIKAALAHGAIPIPAHVDGRKGLLGIQDHNTLKSSLQELTAVEVSDITSETFLKNKSTLSGLSLVSGSDSHKSSAIGRHSLIKMSQPNIEGLRLALLDRELAVRYQGDDVLDPNSASSKWIKKLNLRKLKLRQKDELEIHFNPWLNVIIGGRGSGKSTLLECLRIGLNRIDELNDFPETKSQFDKFFAVSATPGSEGVFLKDSELSVEYCKDNATYRMHWCKGESAPILMERDGDAWLEAGEVISSRFPMRIYSQKQIFEMAKNPHTLRRLMDEDPSLDKTSWKADWDELQARFLRLRAECRRLVKELAERKRIEGERSDVRVKLRIFEQSDHADILKAFQQSQRQQTLVDRHLSALRDQVEDWRATLEKEIGINFAFDPQSRFDENNADHKSLLGIFDDLAKGLSINQQELHSTVSAMHERLRKAQAAVDASAWQAAAHAQREAYERLKKDLEKGGITDPSEYGHLVQQQQLHENRLKELNAKQKRRVELQQECKETYQKLKSLRLKLTDRRREFVTQVLDQNQHVKIELVSFGDRWRAEKDFRDLIGKDRPIYSEDIFDEEGDRGFIRDLYVNQDGSDDPAGISDRIDALKEKLDNPGDELLLYTKVRKRFLQHMENLRQQNPEVMDRLWCWFPEDEVRVSYRISKGRFSPIDHASAGQKTSAILSFLLAYGEEPLILDQPEDDLDNALIYELIVKQLRENKARRQIIVVTHNPNIVVHGDAEWVLPLKIHKGSITEDRAGGLQEIPVRKAICEIMEGGVEAFEQRYRKIHDEVLRR